MALKICHNNEIHKISKAPSSLFELRNKVNSVFRDNLHTHYRLEYIDSDGDHITISNQESYSELLKNELAGPVKSIKVYVVAVRDANVKNTSTSERTSNRQASGPIHIQNKEEFAKELPKPGPKTAETRLGKDDAPSDESLPSSDEDHEEKIQGINEAVEDLKRQGKVNLQPKIYENVEVERDRKRFDKKKKDEDKTDKTDEKEQKKVKKLMDKIREKELSEEKKAKVVKKLMKYKDSLAARQQENATRQQQQALRYTEPRSRSPLELVVTQIVQSMIPEITRLTGGHFTPSSRRERSNEEKTKAVQQSEKATHPRIICDGCHMRPIVGVRYKCTVCPNFDYCENCEEKMGHQHPFIKIRTPQQDYFSPGFLLDPMNRRQQGAGRVASEKDAFHHDFFEPAYGFNSMWMGRPSGFGIEAASSGQRAQKTIKENAPAEKPKAQQQQQQHDQQLHQQDQQHQHQQQQQQQHYYQEHFPQHQQYLQHQYVQKTKAEEKSAQRDKENVLPSQSIAKKDKRNEVEIEDEPYDRALVSRETNELRERQNQEWLPKKGDDKGLEKEKKKDKGDVKSKAGKLKKEFPNVDGDTLIRFVKEAPEDLSTDELMRNFLSWK